LISALYECLFEKFILHSWFITIKLNDKSTSISTQLDSLIPASKISNLTQGMFVGAVSDNFDERIEQKIFHAEILVDSAKVSAEMKAYQLIPIIAEFTNEDGSDNLKETIEANYKRVKQEVLTLVASEIERIKNDPNLKGLIKE
jgi:traG family protein